MLEINKKQLLGFDNVNRARILKYIALGLIKYIGERTDYKRYYLADMVSENMEHITRY